MKLVSYRIGDRESYGAVIGDLVIDLQTRLPKTYRTLRDVLSLDALDDVRRAVDGQTGDHAVTDISFLPVFTRSVQNPDADMTQDV